MGEDKALLPFGRYSTLSEYQYRRLQTIFQKVYISTKDPSKFPFEADFILDSSEVFAPTAGFDAIFKQLHDVRFFVLGVDMPFVDEEVVRKLIEADSEDVDVTAAVSQGQIEALCAIYHRSMEQHFERMLQEGRHKLTKLLDEVKTTKVTFENKEPFLNLNHPREYQKAKEVYGTILQKKE